MNSTGDFRTITYESMNGRMDTVDLLEQGAPSAAFNQLFPILRPGQAYGQLYSEDLYVLPPSSPVDDVPLLGKLDDTISLVQHSQPPTELELLRLHSANSCKRFLNLDYDDWLAVATVRCKQAASDARELIPSAQSIRGRQGVFKITELVPGAHSVFEVGAALKNHVMVILSSPDARPDMSTQVFALQRRALRHFRNNQHLFVSQSPTGLDIWFKCFDEVFFGGMLQGRCTVAFEPGLESESVGIAESHHKSFIHPGFDHSKDKIPMAKIKIRSENPDLSPLERRVHSVETLLHEMTHSFINVYSCHCSSDFGKRCATTYTEGVGALGHGIVWQSCFMIIQEACWKLRLIYGSSATFAYDRETSFAGQMRESIAHVRQVVPDSDLTVDGDRIKKWDDFLAKLFNISRAEMEILELDRENIALKFELAEEWHREETDHFELLESFSKKKIFFWLPDHSRRRFSSAKNRFPIDPQFLPEAQHITERPQSPSNMQFWRVESSALRAEV